MPEIILLIKSTLSILRRFNKIEITLTSLLLSSPYICLVCAYLSGHVLGWISPIYILVLSLGILNIMIDNTKQKY